MSKPLPHTGSNAGMMHDITIAKGLGILLVVIGHIPASNVSVGNEWFNVFVDGIYHFHMPFFMALSGYVFFRPGRVEKLYNTYSTFVQSQFIRLILPFIAMGLLVLVGKMAAQNFLHVDKPPVSFAEGITGLFLVTSRSPSIFIWYIYALFVFSAVTPILFHFIKRPFVWVTAIALALHFAPPIEYLYINMLTPFFIFFIVGGLCRKYQDAYLGALRSHQLLFIAAFIVSFSSIWFLSYANARLLIGALSIPALHSICLSISETRTWLSSMLIRFGESTYFIYLFNTICIGLSKAILFKVTNWHGLNFLWFCPALIVAGILGPMIIERLFALAEQRLNTLHLSRQSQHRQ